jgi:hypothetical protein
MIGRLTYAVLRRFFNIYVSCFDGKEYKNDPNYNIDFIDECFDSRKSQITDSNIFERITNSYNKSKIVQKNVGDVYQVGNEWAPIYKKYMGNIMEVLNEKDLDSMKQIYNNFMREKCSVGLHGIGGYERMKENYFSGNISQRNARVYMKDIVNRFNIWNAEFGASHNLESLKGPLLGNTYGHYVDGLFIEGGAHYNHYYATKISQLIDENKNCSVLELGGGFGSMAYYLMRDSKNITYFDFDLPENFALTAFYLLSAFPEKNIALYGEVDIENDNLSDYDLILMPNFEIEKIKNDSIDLFFNSYSLAEMPPNVIKNYFGIINRVSKKYIYHINHTKYSSMSADNFPINLDKFELENRHPALWNKAINSSMDEFEFLYKKIS